MANPTLSHLRTMLWLRWRLTRNQWRRGGVVNVVIMFIVVYAGLALAAIGSVAGLAAGIFGLPYARPVEILFVFDGLIAVFLFMWMMGLVTELQRSEVFDLTRFLHLPVALRDVFLLNYLASLLCLSMAAIVPAMLGLTLGLAVGCGPAMLLLLPLVLGFFFMITAWTYRLRGWLAALMVNKRRRQAVIMGVTLAFILVFQLPNLIVNVWGGPGHTRPPQTPEGLAQWQAERQAEEYETEAVFNAVHQVVPLLWLPNGAKGLAEGRVWPALWGALGMIALGSWGFAGAYRGTLRFYQGNGTAKVPAASPVTNTRHEAGKTIFVERSLPLVPQPVTALGLAVLRSMSRAPEVKMALTMNIVIFGVIGAGVIMRRPGTAPAELLPFLACGAAAVTFMGLTQLLFNHFGFDRNGFRALVLLPTPRRHILMGKNLALLVVAFGVFSVFLVMVTALARLRFSDVAAAVLEFAAVFLIMSVLGNLASILAPYRVGAGTMKATKMTGLTALLVFVGHFVSMAAIVPAFFPPLLGMLIGYFTPLSVTVATLLCAAVLAGLAALLYWQTLAPLGRLLERREPKILEMVTHEVE
ncbi:MAG: hypothetical protein GXX96_26285 [Planctomycetaceae bacterium]|nr:hypothetical protein [Planctomycetaceae bacterium]